ncbi:MAG: beta-propeller fold lactonase family protein [Holophagales bacterium]|nr:beta-propeller fold lactonase family protein [Holophagales bacterium]
MLATVLLVCAGLLSAPRVSAELSEPHHILYGTVSTAGEPLADGLVTLVLEGETNPIASYQIGSDFLDGCAGAAAICYALRVPMATEQYPGEPRRGETAREGDRADLWIDGLPAGEAVIGAAGTVQPFDIDTSFLPLIPSLSIVDAVGDESSAGPFGFEVMVSLRLSFPIEEEVTVQWQTADGTAAAGSDYAAASGVATFAPGQTLATLPVTIFDDALPEAVPAQNLAGESFSVPLSNPTEARLLDAVGTVTILDDDTPPALQISNLSIVEPPTGNVEAAFRVSLSHAWDQDVSFDYVATGVTAGAADFELAPGSATIPAGSLTTEIVVRILADSEQESDETFHVFLENPVSAEIRRGQGQGTILETPQLLTFVERQRDGESGVDGLLGAIDVALSPDGKHLYAAGRGDDALTLFARDATTGSLSLVASYRDGEGGLEGLRGIESVAVAPGGQRVYAASFDDNALAVFRRDPSDGTLTLIEVEREGARDLESGNTIEGLSGAIALAVVDDQAGGEHVYVAGSAGDALAIFHHDGNLSSFEEVQRNGEGGIIGLGRAVALAASPDGAQLYVASLDDDSVAVFDRDPGTGLLSFVEAHTDGGANDGLAGAVAVAIAPDGSSVYVAGQADNALAVFDRALDGTLTFREAILNGGGVYGLGLATDVAVSHDGLFVYATGFSDDAVAVFDRAPDGSLTFREAKVDDEAGVDGLNGATALVVSADDQQVYATGTLDDSVAVFYRDLTPPSAPDLVASTSHQIGVFSQLTVIDIEWSGAGDGAAGSGIAGYWLLFDPSPDTVPDTGAPSTFVPHGLDTHAMSSPPQLDGETWVHLRACDHGGNCAETVHLGPFAIDAGAPSPPASTSPSHGVGVPSSDTTIDFIWPAATDATSGIAGYTWQLDQAMDWTCGMQLGDETVLGVTSSDLAPGSWYFHACSIDRAGNVSSVSTIGPFVIDLAADLTLASPSHTPGTWSAETTLEVSWSQLKNPVGVSGYSFAFTTDPTTEPDEVIDLPRGDDPHLTTSAPLADGDSHYFHLRVCGTAGSCAPAVHLGPFWIDATPPSAVAGLVANTHAPEVTSNRTSLELEWQPADDDSSGVAGYSVEISSLPTSTCDEVQDVDSPTLSFTSPPLADGTWYAHVCAADAAGNWSSVTSAGPYFIDSSFRALNRLVNPELDEDLSGWLLVQTAPGEILWDGVDVHDLPVSGAAALQTSSGEIIAITQCVAFTGETPYQLVGQVSITSSVEEDPTAFAVLDFFSSPDCSGTPLRSLVTPSIRGDTAGLWPPVAVDGLSPSPTSSALVTFAIQGQVSNIFSGFYDHLFFGNSATVFADDFESGNTSAWSSATP